MNENGFERSPQPLSKDEIIAILNSISSADESRVAAKKLGEFLRTVDTSTLNKITKLRVEGLITHCNKIDAEIDDPERYIRLINENL